MASTFDQARKILKDLQSKATSYVAKDFQRQPIVQGFNTVARTPFGSAAINQVKGDVTKGLPAMFRVANLPLNTIQQRQRGVGEFDIFKNQAMDAFNAAKLGSYALGAPRLATKAGAVALSTSGALGGVMSKATGGSFAEGAGQGVGMTPSIMGITRFTNPMIEKGVSRFAPQLNNTIGKFVAPRVTRGALNVPEGALIDSSLGRRPLSPESMVMDFVSGSVLPGSPNVKAGAKNNVYNVDVVKPWQKAFKAVKDYTIADKLGNTIRSYDSIKSMNGSTQQFESIFKEAADFFLPNEAKNLPIDKQVDVWKYILARTANQAADIEVPSVLKNLDMMVNPKSVIDGAMGLVGKNDAKPLLSDIDTGLEKRAIDTFYETKNPREALYITSDGKLIDGTGKNQVGQSEWQYMNDRIVDHREVAQTVVDGKGGTDALIDYMNKTGNVRMSISSDNRLNVDVSKRPTDAQLNAIKKMSGQVDEIIADASTPTGGVLDSGNFKSFSEYKQFIDRNFPSSPLPQGGKPKGSMSLVGDTTDTTSIPKLSTEQKLSQIARLSTSYDEFARIAKNADLPYSREVYDKAKSPLQPLAEEARKYKSAEEFIDNLGKALPEGPAETRRINFIRALEDSKPNSKRGWFSIANDFYNQSLQGATVKGTTEAPQTAQIRQQPQLSQVKSSEVVPEVPRQAVGGTGGSSSNPIISQQDKYAFNINKPRLGLSGESAKKLDEVVETMRPVLEQRKGKPLTDDEIITAGRKAQLLDTVMGRDESKKFAEALQASRNFLKSESSKQGLSPEFLAQLEIVSSHASDKGRSLRAFAVDAEDAGIKQQVVKDLQKLGIETKRLIEASKNVDWDNAQQVTEFYRKFKPAGFLEKLEEYRYANMLSSPNTQINNIFSNFIQSGIVTPVEKTLTGTLDFARSRLTGKEQKYFAGQGVDYANGYWGSLPQAWKNFRGVLSGNGGLAKPDIDFIPTGTGKVHKAYTTPLRALEATDQFFRTLVIGGETKSLQRAGITGAEAVKKAEAEATYRVFRQEFDPDGKLGQGGVLKVWDKWNVGINHLRQLPGGKWIVPFLQTPTNILKQGVEYSPLGFTTIPGSKEPMVQLSKAMIGSSVFVGAYSLADAGLTTWDAPINKKDKDAFYEAGLQPYSVKIGDKWVSYSKLGPLSYPIAMAAAMKWAKDNGADNNALEIAGAGVGGFLQFFADQSYMQGIGDVIDAARGDTWKQGRSIANIPSQLIPYRALQGWAARLIDPVYRDISGDSIPEQAIDSIKSQVPFLSKTLDPNINSKGEEVKRSNPYINAVSPFKMSEQVGEYMPRSAKAIYGEFNRLKTPEEKVALWEQMVKDKRITKENVSDIKREFLDDQLELTKKDKDIRNSGVADGTRAREIYKEFDKLETPEEKAALWEKYVKAKIITKDVSKQLKYLLQQ